MDSKAITRATRSVLAVIALCFVSFFSAAADLPVVKVGVLKFGTINWEMDVIKRYKLDEKTALIWK